MSKEEQLRIAKEIAQCFSEDLIKMAENIPEEWDGFEIRQLALDYFIDQFSVNPRHSFSNRRTKRRRDYEQKKYPVLRSKFFKGNNTENSEGED